MKQKGVRKVVTRSGRNIRGYFPSRKMGVMIPWESLLERDAILHLEFSPEIIRYKAQPAEISFDQDGETKHWIPDFSAEFEDGLITHIEVKPSTQLAKPELKRRFAAIRNKYECGTIWFQILTEKEIRRKVRLDNLRLLAYHMPKVEDEAELMDAQQRLSILPAQTIAGAAAVLGDIRFVYRLLAANYLSCDLNKPITPETCICYRFGGDDHGAVFH